MLRRFKTRFKTTKWCKIFHMHYNKRCIISSDFKEAFKTINSENGQKKYDVNKCIKTDIKMKSYKKNYVK